MDVQHFKCGSRSHEHRAWCTVCADTIDGLEGQTGAAKARKWAREHVAATGHEVRIDVTRQHGYRTAAKEGP